MSKKIFVKKKNIGRVNPGGGGGVDDPPPENRRVNFGLGFCLYCSTMLHDKVQTSRTILSGRIRVPVGWGGVGGVVCKVIIMSNPTQLS